MAQNTITRTPPPQVKPGDLITCKRCGFVWRTMKSVAPIVCAACKQHFYWMPAQKKRTKIKKVINGAR